MIIVLLLIRNSVKFIKKKRSVDKHIYKIKILGDTIMCLFAAPKYKIYLMEIELGIWNKENLQCTNLNYWRQKYLLAKQSLFCNITAILFGIKIKIYLKFYSNKWLEKNNKKCSMFYITLGMSFQDYWVSGKTCHYITYNSTILMASFFITICIYDG